MDRFGDEANRASSGATISADGNLVAFASGATNLVDLADTNGNTDVFVRDRRQGETIPVSLSVDGLLGTGEGAAISSNGRFVVFQGAAPLVPEITLGGIYNIYRRDLLLGRTELVSTALAGQQPDGTSLYPSVSAEGRYVAFMSVATNLVRNDRNGVMDIFVKDMKTNRLRLVSVGPDYARANGESGDGLASVSISASGRYVAFPSWASNLIANDRNGAEDVFVRDLRTDSTIRASRGLLAEANGGSWLPSLSRDGRFVAFYSDASNLVAKDLNGGSDVFIYDTGTGRTRRLTVGVGGEEAYPSAAFAIESGPAFSADGHTVAFSSWASNLVDEDLNGVLDVFIRRW